MKRGLTGLTIFTFIIGIFAIYLGLGIMDVGDIVSGTGGAFGNELAALGGLWTSLGAVLTFLGILCFPMALGFATMKEWGRQNSVHAVFLIAGISVIAGFLVAYLDFMDSIIYFVLTVLALICGQLLREKKNLFEIGYGSRKRTEPIPTYREMKHVQHNVTIRQSKDTVKVQHKPMVKCGRCGTMNDSDRTHCKMCANKL
ncbi:MAG: hypothetical protein KAR56_01065 [Thermoplasmata archaeon]|nr:hypothetical protein [Thermoplasmata archaeon]